MATRCLHSTYTGRAFQDGFQSAETVTVALKDRVDITRWDREMVCFSLSVFTGNALGTREPIATAQPSPPLIRIDATGTYDLLIRDILLVRWS